jgi:hypothetical protein
VNAVGTDLPQIEATVGKSHLGTSYSKLGKATNSLRNPPRHPVLSYEVGHLGGDAALRSELGVIK